MDEERTGRSCALHGIREGTIFSFAVQATEVRDYDYKSNDVSEIKKICGVVLIRRGRGEQVNYSGKMK